MTKTSATSSSTDKAKNSTVKARKKSTRVRSIEVGAGHVTGFIGFIREQGVVGLAVGLAIGTVASGTVKSIVDGFINPIVRLIVGTESELEDSVWHVEIYGREADFAWGSVVSSLITLLATALVIYLVVHFAKLDRLDKKKG